MPSTPDDKPLTIWNYCPASPFAITRHAPNMQRRRNQLGTAECRFCGAQLTYGPTVEYRGLWVTG